MTCKATVLFSQAASFEGESGETISGFRTGAVGTLYSGMKTCGEAWTREQYSEGDTVKLVKRKTDKKVFIFPWDE